MSSGSDGYPRRLRVRRRREFLRVQGEGEKHHTRHFLVFSSRRPNRGDLSDPRETRLGITVTRKVGNAVVRNRIKRLVREVYRRNHRRFARGLDVVWVAKRNASQIDYAAVVDEFEQVLRRRSLRFGEGTSSPATGTTTGASA